VTAADVNPNAAWSVQRDVARHSPPSPIVGKTSDLLEAVAEPADLIVFNPPWMQGAIHGPLDRALYYQGDLFERFFQQASQALQPGGRVVLVFSSVMQLLRPDLPHPIDTELEQGRFVLETKMRRRVKPTGGRRTRERVEVWVLAAA
jgi:16S rRNA G1207 methylase RsmC